MEHPEPSGADRLLIVDDSKVSRSMAIGLLRNRMPDAQFDEAGDGAAALELASRHRHRLALLDYNMPGMVGIDAAIRIRALQPGLPIVLLTANGQAAVQAKADAAGIHLMRKPIKPELADRIVALAAQFA